MTSITHVWGMTSHVKMTKCNFFAHEMKFRGDSLLVLAKCDCLRWWYSSQAKNFWNFDYFYVFSSKPIDIFPSFSPFEGYGYTPLYSSPWLRHWGHSVLLTKTKVNWIRLHLNIKICDYNSNYILGTHGEFWPWSRRKTTCCRPQQNPIASRIRGPNTVSC